MRWGYWTRAKLENTSLTLIVDLRGTEHIFKAFKCSIVLYVLNTRRHVKIQEDTAGRLKKIQSNYSNTLSVSSMKQNAK